MSPRATQFDLAALDGLPTTPDAQPEIHAQCVRVAQGPHAAGRYAIGLLPTDARVGVPVLALHVGWALARLARRRVGLVDANVRYPAFPVQRRRRRSSGARALVTLDSDVGGGSTAVGSGRGRETRNGTEESMFVEREIDQWLTLLSPHGVGEAGAGVPQLELIVNEYRERFAHLVVDLTGFQRLGDHLNAIALLDGVVIVARARCSRERDLLRLKQEIADEVTLGVILLG